MVSGREARRAVDTILAASESAERGECVEADEVRGDSLSVAVASLGADQASIAPLSGAGAPRTDHLLTKPLCERWRASAAE